MPEKLPFASVYYNSKYCPICNTLVYPYEQTGEVCNCKDPWLFVTDHRDSSSDPIRQTWVDVQVCIFNQAFLKEIYGEFGEKEAHNPEALLS